jgi:hypothetical protein
MTSDGTGIVIDLPAADVQTSASGRQSTLAWLFGLAAQIAARGACIGFMTAGLYAAAL